MVHNGIEYGDMQLIAESYDILRTIGGLSNDELATTFSTWNAGELDSFLIEITARIFSVTEKDADGAEGAVLDKILDKTGMKGTGASGWAGAREPSPALPAPKLLPCYLARTCSRALQAGGQSRRLRSGPLPRPPWLPR